MKFKPLHDKILIKLVEVETKTAGGILIPDNAQQKPSQGEVVASGEGLKNKKGEMIALSVKVGDKVFFEKWAGKEIKLDGVDYLIIKESDVLGIIE